MKELKLFLAVVGVIVFSNVAYAADTLKEAITEAKFYGDIRIRYENVDQDGISSEAHSSTIRTRIGIETDKFHDVVIGLEGENVSYLGKDNYNDTVNGRTSRPIVADPENTQINQAYVQYFGVPKTAIKAGRQVIALDGHRFIGHVGWRQNNQVFDAFTLENTSIKDTLFKYGYIYNVNRIFGEQSTGGDWGSKSHYFNISNTSLPIGKIIYYGYLLDFGSDSIANSSKTFGGSLTGQKKINDDVTFKYHGEVAHQRDYGANTLTYGANYYHVAPSLTWKNLITTIGYEVLGSDDSAIAFRTPLATLHKWNGWADKFLTTPASGLVDLYIDLTYKIKDLEGGFGFLNGLVAKLQYHDFDADDGGMDHGSEWGVSLKKPISEYVSVGFKYADYDADNTATDTQKITFDVGIKF